MRNIKKKFSFLIPVITCSIIMVFMAGCEKITEKNKAIARRSLEEIWSQGKMDVIDELIAADCVLHNPAFPDIHGPEGYKQLVADVRSAFPDLRLTVYDQIAEGDKVVTRWTLTGTHKGDFMGIPPTGVQVTVTGIDIDRIAGGKIVEEWTNDDVLGLMQQLGVIPPIGQGEE